MSGLVLASGYRMRRLKTFLDPWADPLKDGFQLTQSLIAIGRGDWFGVGLGAGSGFADGNQARAGRSFGPDYSKYAAAPAPVSKAGSAHGLRVGLKVFHTKFGEGTVLALEGVGDDARAQINFPRHGIKWLALSVAKLTPVP